MRARSARSTSSGGLLKMLAASWAIMAAAQTKPAKIRRRIFIYCKTRNRPAKSERAPSNFGERSLFRMAAHGRFRWWPRGKLESEDRLAEMDLVAIFEFGAAAVAMDLLAHPGAHDPDAAFGRPRPARIPAVIEQPVFAGGAVVLDVGVLARNGFMIENDVIAAVKPAGAVDVGD